ncbi:MAG: hypothetical protein P8K79_07255 [Mariniblastus sp.]|nr:hypothetical protein [Mariniblastus sp.]
MPDELNRHPFQSHKMANTIRIILAVFSIYLIGAYLCGSPELVGNRPTRSTGHISLPLFTTICTFVVLETFLIGLLFRQRGSSAADKPRQFGISSLLIGIWIFAIPLAMSPIYESVVATMPSHPRGDRGLPNWLFIGIVYFMLVPIAYLCHTVKRIVQSIQSPSAG